MWYVFLVFFMTAMKAKDAQFNPSFVAHMAVDAASLS
jgi:hypothetical protein